MSDPVWDPYFESKGMYLFEADELETSRLLDQEREVQERLQQVYKGQNRLLRKVAEAVDANYPSDEFSSKPSPGDIVRAFIIKDPKEAAAEASQGQGG